MPKRTSTAGRETVGSRIVLLRTMRGWTQPQLCAKARPKLTQGTLSEIEHDLSPKVTARVILALARALEANPYWIAFGEGQMAARIEVTPDHAQVIELYENLTPANRAAWLSSGHGLLRDQPPGKPSKALPYPMQTR